MDSIARIGLARLRAPPPLAVRRRAPTGRKNARSARMIERGEGIGECAPEYGLSAGFVGCRRARCLVYPNVAPLGGGANSCGNYIIYARYADRGHTFFFWSCELALFRMTEILFC